MEKIFVDTSALFALVSMEDQAYTTALSSWGEMVYSQSILITNNYVLVECFSLLQHRLGIEAVRDLQLRIVPLLQLDWISEQGHSSIVNDVLTANRRQLSLVDCSCFESMRRMGINKVFSFDDHFHEQGFEVIP
jgi:predicted nucleic acid-binding protein